MKAEQDRLKLLLQETISLLCKNGLGYKSDLKIEGVLGITVDSNDVFIVHLNETLLHVNSDSANNNASRTGSDEKSQQHIVTRSPRRRRSPGLSTMEDGRIGTDGHATGINAICDEVKSAAVKNECIADVDDEDTLLTGSNNFSCPSVSAQSIAGDINVTSNNLRLEHNKHVAVPHRVMRAPMKTLKRSGFGASAGGLQSAVGGQYAGGVNWWRSGKQMREGFAFQKNLKHDQFAPAGRFASIAADIEEQPPEGIGGDFNTGASYVADEAWQSNSRSQFRQDNDLTNGSILPEDYVMTDALSEYRTLKQSRWFSSAKAQKMMSERKRRDVHGANKSCICSYDGCHKAFYHMRDLRRHQRSKHASGVAPHHHSSRTRVRSTDLSDVPTSL